MPVGHSGHRRQNTQRVSHFHLRRSDHVICCTGKETWGFTSTETIKAYYKETGKLRSREFLYLTPTRYTVTTGMTLLLRWAAV